MNNFVTGETLQLFLIDDDSKSVISLPCKCSRAEYGQFWIEDKGYTANFGTHVFLTEREALEKASEMFEKRAEYHASLEKDFDQAKKECLKKLEAMDKAAKREEEATKKAEEEAEKEAGKSDSNKKKKKK